MKWATRQSVRLLPLVLLSLLAASKLASASTGPHSFVEDFNTTTYRDSNITEANWNAASGKVEPFPFAPRIYSGYDTGGESYDVAISGRYAYVADGTAGLRIFDIGYRNIVSPRGIYDTPDFALGVAVVGTTVYVTDRSTGLLIIDASTPTAPVLLGSYNTPVDARHVAVSGGRAYVADASSGLLILDVVNPAAPVLLGTYNTPGAAEGVALAGSVAYVADRLAGLLILDVRNPAAPALLGSYNTPGDARDVDVSRGVAYVADYASGLQIIDVSNTAAPTLLSSYNTTGLALQVALSGDVALVADEVSGLEAFNVINPAAPSLLSSFNTPGLATGVAVSGAFALVADQGAGILSVQIGTERDADEFAMVSDPYSTQGLAVSGNRAYLATKFGGLFVLDLRSPANPAVIGTFPIPLGAEDAAIDGNMLHVADALLGLQLVDVSNPASPSLVGVYDTPGAALSVAISGTVAYVADLVGLAIVNVSNPSAPTQMAYLPQPDSTWHVAVSGTIAYVAVGGSGVRIYDVANPAVPVLLATYNTVGEARRLLPAGDILYVADGSAGVSALSVRVPSAPTLLGSCSTPGSAVHLALSGTRLFVVLRDNGFVQIDVSEPNSIHVARSHTEFGPCREVAISGESMWIAGGLQLHGFEILQHRFDTLNSDVYSTPLPGVTDTVRAVRIQAAQIDSVQYLATAAGPFTLTASTPGTHWQAVAPGKLLIWGANLAPRAPTLTAPGPEISHLTIEWLYDHADIEAVADIANDQGRQVRLKWFPSGHDVAGSSSPIVEYAIYRRVDSGALASGRSPADLARAALDPEIAEALAAGWDYVTTVPADFEDSYSTVVPTLGDSTISGGQRWTAFKVRARTATPGQYFDSPPDSGYSLDNLAPNVPAGLLVTMNAGSAQLSWDDPVDDDFRFFRVYRSSSPGFQPGPANLVHSTTSTGWTDSGAGGGAWYKVSAVDFAGNESAHASGGITVGVGGPGSPARFALHPAGPNPFRASTTIRFDVPASGGRVRLGIFDVAGRRVRGLADVAATAGTRSVTWDGRGDDGRALAAGLYLCRMEAGSFSQVRRVLIAR